MANDTVAADTSLVMVRKDGRSQEIPLHKERTVIGRHTGCQIRVPLAAVSRQHCELRRQDDGSLVAKDLGSSNGTYVNKVRVEESTTLQSGDVLAVGPIVFVVRVGGEPTSIDASAAWAKGNPETDASPGDAKAPTASQHAPAPLLGSNADNDDSSMADFDFDFDLSDDDDDQPDL